MTSRRHRPNPEARLVTIRHDGETIPAYEGEPLAAALMASGIRVLSRSAKYHRPRGATCGSGDCAHCLVAIDGLPNRCACTAPCRDGMVSASQNVLGSAKHDLLGITDWMFPWGLDHHEMFTGVPLMQPVVQKIVRKLSGLGALDTGSEEAPDPSLAQDCEQRLQDPISIDVLVVGAGSSGCAAAESSARSGADVLLVEALGFTGGRLSSGLHGEAAEAETAANRLQEAGARVWTNAGAVQIDRNECPLEVLVLRKDRLARVRPKALVLANGGYRTTGIFENNDLPGVLTAEWAAALLSRWGVLAGEKPLVCADEPLASTLRSLFSEAGAPPVRMLPLRAAHAALCAEPPPTRLVAARGGRQVEKAVIETPEGEVTVACDAIIVASPPAPAFELALNAGAKVAYEPQSGGFAVVVDELGRTASEDVFACGTLNGPCSVEEARRGGEAAGRLAADAARSKPNAGNRPAGEGNRHAS